jgi:hypothetical protein
MKTSKTSKPSGPAKTGGQKPAATTAKRAAAPSASGKTPSSGKSGGPRR